MAAKIGSLIVDLSANTAKLQRDMAKATNIVSKTSRQMKTAFKGVAIALGAAFSGRAMIQGIEKIIDLGDELGKTSKRVGVSVESLSALRYSAELAGTSFEGVQKALKMLSKNMFDMTLGIGQGRYAFDEMGISVNDTNGKMKTNETLLLEIADKFRGMADGAKKAALAQYLFGRAGMDIIPLLNQGSEGLRTQREELEKMGALMSTETASAYEKIKDEITTAGKAVEGLGIQIGTALIPVIESAITVFRGMANIISTVRDGFNEFKRVIADFVNSEEAKSLVSWADDVTKKVGGIFGDIAESLGLGRGDFKMTGGGEILVGGKKKGEIPDQEIIPPATKRKTKKKTSPQQAMAEAKVVFDEMQTKALESFYVVSDSVKKAGDEAVDFGYGFSNTISDTLGQIVTNTQNAGDILNNLWKQMLGNMVSNLANMALSAIPGGGIFGSIGKLFGFAEGGIAYSPMVAKIAEKEPEVIIPFSKLGEGIGGGTTVNLTVNLDSSPILRAVGKASKDGRLEISSRAVV